MEIKMKFILSLILLLINFNVESSPLCGNYDAVHIGNYRITNNVWNDVTGSQCFDTDATGKWWLNYSSHVKPTNGAPASYPFSMRGCHYGQCSVNNPFPKQVSQLTSLTSSWSIGTLPAGIYNVAYDIWFDTAPMPGNRAANAQELMIWINKQGAIQPIGSVIATNILISGTFWTVWHGGMVTTYVRNTGTTSVTNLNIKSFVDNAINRGYISTAWYLISVQSGFEIWQGGQNLITNSFSVQ